MDIPIRLDLAEAPDWLPASSKLFGGIVVLLSVVRNFWSGIDEGLALVPHHTIYSPVLYFPVPFIWNVFTGNFMEGNIIKALLMAPPIVLLTQMLEQLWSPKAMFIHVAFSTASAGTCAFIAQIVVMHQTHRERHFFTPVRGTIGLLMSICVGLRHAYPLQSPPMIPKNLGLTCQNLPFCLLVLIVAIRLLAPPWVLPEWQFGTYSFLFSWLYIRYFMWFPMTNSYGDHGSDFAFSCMFPRALRPLVDVVAAIVYNFAMCLAPATFKVRDEDGNLGASNMYNVAGQNSGAESVESRLEYEARRTKALAFLDENIAALLKVSENKGQDSTSVGSSTTGRESGLDVESNNDKDELPAAQWH